MCVLWIKPKALDMLSKFSATELSVRPNFAGSHATQNSLYLKQLKLALNSCFAFLSPAFNSILTSQIISLPPNPAPLNLLPS